MNHQSVTDGERADPGPPLLVFPGVKETTTMTDAIHRAPPYAAARPRPPGPGPAALARRTAIGLGAALAVVGVVQGVLAVATAPTLPLVFEVAMALAVAVPGVLIARLGVSGRHPLDVGVLLPEIVLAGDLVYLAVAMPVFHAAAIPYPLGVAQFATVVLGLVLGTAGLVLAGASTKRAAEAGRVSFPLAVRDSVILIVGTIVVAIGSGQLAEAQLNPPKWNWISFLGITVVGMLILVGREMVKQAHRRDPTRRPAAAATLTGAMLVGGLFIMVWGSVANLTQGKNGYATGFAGNTAGLVVLVAAAMFLLVRGAVITLRTAHTGGVGVTGGLVANLALAVGVIAFLAGERSLIMGKTLVPSFGTAFPAAAVIVLAGLLILIPGRVLGATDAAARDGADHAGEAERAGAEGG